MFIPESISPGRTELPKISKMLYQVTELVEEKLSREEEMGRTAVLMAVGSKLIAVGK